MRPTFATAVIAIGLGSAAILATHVRAQNDVQTTDAQRDAVVAVTELAGQLRKSLGDALASGGAVGAVAACQSIAPALSTSINSQQNLTIKRTALRVRNPANTPDDFERRILTTFIEKAAAGADPATLSHSEVISTPTGKALRFMKAIPMADQPCAACHGSKLAPNVADEITRLYPSDKAVDFTAGDIRGAFSVIKPLP